MSKSSHDRDNINFTYHVVYLIMCWLYLCIILLCTFSSCYTYRKIIHLYILYGINIFNGKMGKPNAYLYSILGQHFAKLLLVYDFKPMVKAST